MQVRIFSVLDNEGKSIFPEMFSDEKLKSLRSKIGSYDFASLYENKIISNTNADFKSEYLQTFDKLPDGIYNTFLLIDLGGEDLATQDPTAFIIVKVDRKNDWYIPFASEFWGSILDIDKKIFELNNVWQPRKIGIEKEKYTIALMPILKQEMIEKNTYLNIEELKIKIGDRRSGRDRILSLQGRWESKRIFIQKNQTSLIDQITRYPKSSHDDLLSALSYANNIAFKPHLGIFQKRRPENDVMWQMTRSTQQINK